MDDDEHEKAIRRHMPLLREFPRHAPKTFHLPVEHWNNHFGLAPRASRSFTLWPWRRMNRVWWSLVRPITFWMGDHHETNLAARLYVNGCGQDHELRFYVWDGLAPNVRVAEGRDVCQWQYGAANSFRRVTKGLLDATVDPQYRHPVERIGARGLYGFSKADVLTVARWADNFILRLYHQPHEVDAMGGDNDPVEITEPYRRPPSTGGGGFLEDLFDEKEGT